MSRRLIIISYIVLASLLILSGCAAPASRPSSGASALNGSPTQRPPASNAASRQVLDTPRAGFLSPASGGDGNTNGGYWTIASGSTLIAVSRLFGMTIGVVTPDYKVSLSPSPPDSLGNIQASRGGMRLAYLTMPGIDPAENLIETVNLSTGRTQRVKAARGFAIFGFTLGPGGKNLAFSEAEIVGTSSRQVSWRLLTADLQSGQVREVTSSAAARELDESVPVPFAWSAATGDIYLNTVRPFRGGGGKGIWTLRPDGSGLRRLLSEDQFVGLPLLSPDGSSFAYLASDLGALPSGFIAGFGEPPGNIVQVKDLKTGQERVVAQEKDCAIGALAWSRDGDAVIASRREWVDNSLRDVSIVAFSVKNSTEKQRLALPPASNVNDIFDARAALLWVNSSPKGTDLMLSRGNGPSASILAIPDGQIRVVGYLD